MIKKQNQDGSGKRTVRLEETGSLFCCGSNSFLSSHLFALSFNFSPSSLSCSRFGVHTRRVQHATFAPSLPFSHINRKSSLPDWPETWRCCVAYHCALFLRHRCFAQVAPGEQPASQSRLLHRPLSVG